jgi:hypothetical protein
MVFAHIFLTFSLAFTNLRILRGRRHSIINGLHYKGNGLQFVWVLFINQCWSF